MTRRWLMWAAGYVLFAVLFAVSWRPPQGWDRIRVDWLEQRAVAALKEVAGIDATGWARSVEARLDPVHQRWQQRHARLPIDRMITPLGITFRFRNPDQRVEVTVSPDGKPRRIRRNDHNPGRPAEADPDALAESAVRVIAGEFAAQFRRDDSDRGQPYRWKAVSPSDGAHAWIITVRFEEGRFQSADLEPRFEDRRRRGIARDGHFFESEGYGIAQGITLFAGSMWALMAYLMGWARGTLDHRLAWAAGLGFALFEALENVGTGPFQWTMLLGSAGAGLMAAALTGPGRAWMRGLDWPRWMEFVMFLRGQWAARPVGSAIVRGLGWAGAVAAVPLVLMAVVPIGGSALEITRFMDAALSRWPLINALAPLLEHQSYGLFVFFLPALYRRFYAVSRFPVLFAGLAAVVLFLVQNPFSAGVPVSVATAIGLAALLTWIYWNDGLLTLLTAMKGSAVLLLAASFFRAGEWLLLHGIGLIAVLAGVSGLALFVSLRGNDSIAADDAGAAGEFVPERERLKAEFSLAQRAQQVLLPSTAPGLPGFSLAGICLPARDVGGDLYDYYDAAGGRLGICVADVSGKGMAAALYMTLTKGILSAAAPECDDVAELARHVNRHIYAAGKRKVFVTAVFAAVDPASRTVEYVRAGHNPVLYRPEDGRETRYLEAPGMGLGMTNGGVFDRVTRVQRITLAPGDTLVFYSDGVTEAMNPALEQYGEERLLQLVRNSAARAASDLVEQIRSDVAAFAGAQPPHDDVTVLVLKA